MSIFATGTSAEHIETIYMDGIEYTLEIDTEGNSIISAVFDGVLTTLELNNETGEGVVSNSNPTERDEIIVQVNELNENEVSIEIVNEEANQITSINSIEDLLDESYIGQALTLGGWALGAAVAALLAALAKIAITIVVAGITYYALHMAADKVKNGFYYRAYIPPSNSKLEAIYVNFSSITSSQAINRIKNGDSTYTFFSSGAKSIVASAGRGVTASENHYNTSSKKGVFFSHYHTSTRNGAHSFYGTPSIRK